MQDIKLIWITPNTEQVISDCARVSNPDNQGKDGTSLIKYLIKNKHWSPLEMASMCVEINTTRDIARQLLRHRSFSFQEFSQRYSTVEKLSSAPLREARLQDSKNRQNSIKTNNVELQRWWEEEQQRIEYAALYAYKEALSKGIAKEVARVLLPEGLTTSRLYMSGSIRSWFHFCEVRCGNGTQKETMDLAWGIRKILKDHCPNIEQALLEHS